MEFNFNQMDLMEASIKKWVPFLIPKQNRIKRVL